MTDRDDRLAPVTPLFGAKTSGSGRSRRRADSQSPPADQAGLGADEWANSAAPGADEVGTTDAGTTDAGTTDSGTTGAGTTAAGTTGAGTSETGAERAGTSNRRSPLRAVETDSDAFVSPLPTYAAFAATTEGAESRVRFAADHADDDDDDDEAADPEPESLEAAQQRAENISLHALSRRGVSSSEMAKTLRSRDLPEEVVVAEVERLERVGLLDDAALAENLVRSKQDRKGLGKGAITAELRQRGLAQEAIEQAVSEIDDDEEQARCDEWALKRAGQLRGLDQTTAERRLNAFLMRRGYRSEVIRRAVEKALPRRGRGGGVRFE